MDNIDKPPCNSILCISNRKGVIHECVAGIPVARGVDAAVVADVAGSADAVAAADSLGAAEVAEASASGN